MECPQSSILAKLCIFVEQPKMKDSFFLTVLTQVQEVKLLFEHSAS